MTGVAGQVIGAAALGTAFGYAVALVAARPPSAGEEAGAVALVALFGAVLIVSLPWLLRGDWFHPAAFPLLYVAACAALPIGYLTLVGQPLANPGIDPFDLSPELIAVFALTLLGFAVGIAAGLRLPRSTRLTGDRSADFRLVLLAGRVLLGLALAARAFIVVTTFGLPYGVGSVTFGLAGTAEAAAGVTVFAGTVFVVMANVRLRRRALSLPDVSILAVYVVTTLLAGGRGDLLAPAVFVLWAHHTYVRRIGFSPLAAAAIAVLLVFQGVSGSRVNEPFLQGPNAAVQRTLGSIATPVQAQSVLMSQVPDNVGYLGGSTYLASVVRQVPGPISNAVLGAPDDTGSFELRRILGFTNPNFGFGFSLPSEGYLNFGFPGVALVTVVAGGLFGWAYRQRAALPSRALHLLYPLLVATLPTALRSDALEQIKLVLYPMLLLSIALYLSGRWGRAPGSD